LTEVSGVSETARSFAHADVRLQQGLGRGKSIENIDIVLQLFVLVEERIQRLFHSKPLRK